MKIDLSKLHDETLSSISFEGEIKKNELDINGREIKFIEPIKYDGKIYKVDDNKIVHVNITYVYEEICGRCLEPFVNRESTVLSGKLVRKSNDEDDDEVVYYSDEKLDLTEDIISMIILSLPMKPLCDEECKGICPKCGVNRNEEDCDCVIEDIDPRFAILKDFSFKE
ncbi:DUF177 domain-containing protein [Schnuerera sp. xch1]|uniref:YceD family protein n=1 Tax=Schnuerera sp. xch1 TaxID=2874283 RepID=UPI001CC00D7F|nr:DUF177 domain-containing protein [Schnuerera sp. xch1]MBZ2173908.1 DUF177 domain-containing protein [Schnuerera sp. xch1]